MFRKLVSNLPFSPALVGQVGFYARRLRKEETTRRIGLIFVVLALIVQCLAIFQPSESANASSSNDMISGGISSLNDYLKVYDSNGSDTKPLKDFMNHLGITRDEIKISQYSSFRPENKLSWGYSSKFSFEQGERQYSITNTTNEQNATVYSRPVKLWGYSTQQQVYGWIGHSDKMGWFAIMQSNGNLVTNRGPLQNCSENLTLFASDPNCKPCPTNKILQLQDSMCISNIIKEKTATNTSRGFVEASSIKTHAGDQISYTISVKNIGLETTNISLEEKLDDVLEYSTIIDGGGGTLNKETKTLSWPDVQLEPKNKQTRTFVIKVHDTIPATAIGFSDPTSYDCTMTNIFGNSIIKIKIDCPTPKVIEQITSGMPKFGLSENILFSGFVLFFSTYFYVRSKQIRKEIHLVRKEASVGTI